jgi:hypothetical protein
MGKVDYSYCDICGRSLEEVESEYLCPVVFQSGTPGEEDHFILANAFCMECYDRDIRPLIDGDEMGPGNDGLASILEDIGEKKYEMGIAASVHYLI